MSPRPCGTALHLQHPSQWFTLNHPGLDTPLSLSCANMSDTPQYSSCTSVGNYLLHLGGCRGNPRHKQTPDLSGLICGFGPAVSWNLHNLHKRTADSSLLKIPELVTYEQDAKNISCLSGLLSVSMANIYICHVNNTDFIYTASLKPNFQPLKINQHLSRPTHKNEIKKCKNK